MIKERIKEVIYVSVWEFHTENNPVISGSRIDNYLFFIEL